MSPGWKPGMLTTAPHSHLELVTGVEPATFRLQGECSTVEPHQHKLDQTMGVEPISGAYQAPVLPVTPRLHSGAGDGS